PWNGCDRTRIWLRAFTQYVPNHPGTTRRRGKPLSIGSGWPFISYATSTSGSLALSGASDLTKSCTVGWAGRSSPWNVTSDAQAERAGVHRVGDEHVVPADEEGVVGRQVLAEVPQRRLQVRRAVGPEDQFRLLRELHHLRRGRGDGRGWRHRLGGVGDAGEH